VAVGKELQNELHPVFFYKCILPILDASFWEPLPLRMNLSTVIIFSSHDIKSCTLNLQSTFWAL